MSSPKCRTKALRIAVSEPGVISVAVKEQDKDQLVVIGMNVDSAGLTKKLRMKVGYATLVSVEAVNEDEEDRGNEDEPKSNLTQFQYTSGYPYYGYHILPVDQNQSVCTII
ncbi:hypothetical protein Nepgr_007709 [Nepenthes gracilis]|uniref:Uncharacterized protein n=1 Tax=Nepenthes gracilis TaxID=150966 RepID=A0AAD3S7Q5_NEPGR|nr:hypothetical protein Nepgr_007709 [Nepenthes gracilis]